jgi:hypothetical protein
VQPAEDVVPVDLPGLEDRDDATTGGEAERFEAEREGCTATAGYATLA